MTRLFFTTAAFIGISVCACGQVEKQYETMEYKDLSYLEAPALQEDSLQKLNLVLPKGIENYPLLVWVGGGAWSYGDKNQEMDLARNLAQKGIAVASVGHRLSPAIWRDSSLKTGIQHPKHIEDLAAAVKWIYKHAAEYGYDQTKLFVGGYSSGAHLAALISLDSSYLAKEGLSTKIFRGIIPVSGAYDIQNYHEVFLNGNRPELASLHVEAVFGNTQKALINASPTKYLDNLSAPMLLICDNNLYNYTRLFEDRIRETDFRNVEVVYAYNLSHGGLWRDLSNEASSSYRKIIVDFIEKQTAKG